MIGENGLIAKSKQSGKKAEISSEKEAIQISATQAIEEENGIANLKKYLDYNVGKDKAETINNGNTLVVKFNDSNRYYEVDFESIFSYNDYTTTKYGDLNKDGIIVGIICIIIISLFIKVMPKRTPFGNEIFGKLKGFKRFLETAQNIYKCKKKQLHSKENCKLFFRLI